MATSGELTIPTTSTAAMMSLLPPLPSLHLPPLPTAHIAHLPLTEMTNIATFLQITLRRAVMPTFPLVATILSRPTCRRPCILECPHHQLLLIVDNHQAPPTFRRGRVAGASRMRPIKSRQTLLHHRHSHRQRQLQPQPSHCPSFAPSTFISA